MPRERKKKAPPLDDGTDPGPKPAKKRRGSAANSRGGNTPTPGTPNGIDTNGHNQMYVPQPHMSYGETMHASNPFDDTPMMQPMGQPHPGMGQPPMHGMHPNMPPNGPMGPPPPSHMHGPPMSSNNMMNQPMMSPHNGMMHTGPMPPNSMMPPMRGPNNGPRGLPPCPPMNLPPGLPPGGPPGGPPPPNSIVPGRTYPPDQSMIFNSNNPNAPPIYPCGSCHKEVNESDQGILCESGCNFWFHRVCTGLSEKAYVLLKAEVYAEWVCDNCLHSKQIPLIKFKP